MNSIQTSFDYMSVIIYKYLILIDHEFTKLTPDSTLVQVFFPFRLRDCIATRNYRSQPAEIQPLCF